MAEPELYLFTGPELGEKNEAIAKLKADARTKYGVVDEYSWYAGDTSVNDVVSQLLNESLFSSAVFIVLRNAELIKTAADIEQIASWAKGSAGKPNTLVLVSDSNGVEKKLEACVPSSHKKIFWEMFENRKSQWVQDFFRKNGFGVSADAVDAILEMIENNTESLKAECSRFFYCFEKGHVVSLEDVDKILSHNREEDAFTLFAAMAAPSESVQERLETSVGILQKIRLSRSSASRASGIISGLTYCFRQLRLWHSLHANRAVPSDKDLKASGFTSKKKITQYENASRVWNAGQTASVISLLASTDMALRESGTTLEDVQLFRMLYAIVVKSGLYCATYEKQIC